MHLMHGLPTIGTIGFGWLEVSGRSRALLPGHDDRLHGCLTVLRTAAAYDTAAATARPTPIQKMTRGQSVPAGVAITSPMPA